MDPFLRYLVHLSVLMFLSGLSLSHLYEHYGLFAALAGMFLFLAGTFFPTEPK